MFNANEWGSVRFEIVLLSLSIWFGYSWNWMCINDAYMNVECIEQILTLFLETETNVPKCSFEYSDFGYSNNRVTCFFFFCWTLFEAHEDILSENFIYRFGRFRKNYQIWNTMFIERFLFCCFYENEYRFSLLLNFLFSVMMESTTVLGAIFGFVALMLVFLLYFNRKWCFHSTPGFPCCDENSLPSKYIHKMGEF